MASTDAAGPAPRPLPPNREMKGVRTRPLVDRPQMKEVPASSQKVRLRAASASTLKGVPKFMAMAGGGGAEASPPKGARPRSEGRSRTNSRASTAIKALATNTGTVAEIGRAHV